MSDGLYIGLMTGTSADAIDTVLCRISANELELIDAIARPFAAGTPARIKTLFEPGSGEIDALGSLDADLAGEYASAVKSLLKKSKLSPADIAAIGCHGQTIRHRPSRANSTAAFTLQIGDANVLAAQTGIKVVADFRRMDIALGGQGAPLAPAFHHFLLAHQPEQVSAFLNIGGIANVTIMSDTLIGFDTGPGNALLDYWVSKHLGRTYDGNGEWAKSGNVIPELLDRLLQHPYFQLLPPKSTGKEEFTPGWLENALSELSFTSSRPEDVQATLVALTSQSIAAAIANFEKIQNVYVCGGGFHNSLLMAEIESKLEGIRLLSTEALGVHPDWVEASAFAWLAHKRVNLSAVDLCSVTGASKPALLGAIWMP